MIFWQHILKKLQDDQKVYVLTVIENSGSSPGRKGFKMLVAQDKFIYGSVGGGVMEFALVEEAHQLLTEDDPPTFIKKQIHRGSNENSSGMICSGEQTVAFHCVRIDDISIVESIIYCLQNGDHGILRITPESFTFVDGQQADQFSVEINSKEDWVYEEQIGFKEKLYIIGGGHVGVAVSELFAKLGFYIVVIDNRHDLNTLENNDFVHHKVIVDYNDIKEYVPQESNNYIVIMTNKYTDDILVVRKLLKDTYKFIGVLGSKAKLKTMMKDLRKEGFTKEELGTINAPVGLPIKSETPEEIAVSIAAQIIQVKNKGRK